MGKYVKYKIHTASDVDMDPGEEGLWFSFNFSSSWKPSPSTTTVTEDVWCN
jgi:hypothetical protein